MAKRSSGEVDGLDEAPEAKRPKLSPQRASASAVPDALVQRTGIIEMSRKADAPFRIDNRGDVDCSLDWCTYTNKEYSKTPTKGMTLRVIEVHLTSDKVVFPPSVPMFNGFVIFTHGIDKIKGRIPFLSSWVQYEFTIVEDKSAKYHPADDGLVQCNIIKCRWKIPVLDDQRLVELLAETGVAVSQEDIDIVRTGVVKYGGYDEDTDTYDPKAVVASLPDPKNSLKLQNSTYMILRYCATAVLLFGHSNTIRTSYVALVEISKCLLSANWYFLFFQWFKRMPGTFLPQESRFLRELSLDDLSTVKNYFCIQPSPENTIIEDCIKLYNQMKLGPHRNRDTLCHLTTTIRESGILTPEHLLIPFATRKSILRTESYESTPGKWILTFGDFESERIIANLLVSLKKKEKDGLRATPMFDTEYIDKHRKLDEIQKGVLYDIISPINNRRVLVFSGQAGSGKTTLIKAIIESARKYSEKHAPPPPKPEFGKPQKPVEIPEPAIGVFTAYGIMAASIRNSTGHTCTMTLSRAIALLDMEESTTSKVELMSIKTVIIDEMSTANMTVIAHLLSGMPQVERIFFFGDPNQMPTIDRGSICECFVKIFKAIDIDQPDTISLNPDCTIFNLKRNYRQAGNEILINNFAKILKADASEIDFHPIRTLKELQSSDHSFIVIPISPDKNNAQDVTRAMNIISQQYLQSAEDSQKIMIMAQRNEDVSLLKDCLQNCDTYIKKLMPSQSKQMTLDFHPHSQNNRHQSFGGSKQQSFQKTKARALVVGELVKTTMNWYSKTGSGAPNVEYLQTGNVKTVPLITSTLTNNDIGILHAIYDVNTATGRILKSHTNTGVPTTRPSGGAKYARVLVLKPPNAKFATGMKKKKKSPNAAKKNKKDKETEYLFINTQEYALSNVVPRDAMTIAVSQGQEAEVSCIYLPPHMFESKTFERSQFYTGVTRGKKRVILITPIVNGRLPAVENILSNETIPGKTNFTEKYQASMKQANL